MGTSLTAKALFLDGVTDNAQSLREQLASALLSGGSASGTTGIAARAGVRPGQSAPLKVTASSGMTVAVAAGVAFVQGGASTTAGIYTLCLDTSGTVTVATADVTNPRIDNVIARITDNGDNTSTATVELQTGVPGSSPSAPTPPVNSLLLAQIAVAANATSITSGNITDKRPFTAAAGGIIPVRNSLDKPPTTDTPLYRHVLDVTPAIGGTSPLEYSVDGANWYSVFDSSDYIFGAWTDLTLSSGFTAGTATPQYRTTPGFGVQFRGVLLTTGTVTSGTAVWTGSFNAPQNHQIPFACANATGQGYINYNTTTGTIWPVASLSVGTEISLEGIWVGL